VIALRRTNGSLMWVGLRAAEWHHYDIWFDRMMVRLSVFDPRGQEHFCLVPETTAGRKWQDVRARATEALMQHIEAGEPAQEVFLGDPEKDYDEPDEEDDQDEDDEEQTESIPGREQRA
jgi:hypothetical protein